MHINQRPAVFTAQSWYITEWDHLEKTEFKKEKEKTDTHYFLHITFTSFICKAHA